MDQIDAPLAVAAPVVLGASGLNVEALIAAAFDEYAPRLKTFARAATRDDAAADDIVQEAFLRLVREVRLDRTPDNIGGWLFRVAANCITSRGRRQTVADRARTFLVNREVGRSAEDTALRRELDGDMMEALAQLPRDARVALLMAAQGSSSNEIGLAISKTPAATRTYICRARLRLREALASREASR